MCRQEGRKKDGDARGGLRQWVCAAFWVTNSGETSLLESSPKGISSTPEGDPGHGAERTGGISARSTLCGL